AGLKLLELGEGLDAIPGLDDLVSTCLEDLAGESADGGFVFDEEYRLGADVKIALAAFKVHGRLGSARFGKIDLERRAMTRLRVDPDIAAGLFDDTVNRRESQPRPAAHGFCREERFEDSAFGLFVHPDPGIAHGEGDI